MSESVGTRKIAGGDEFRRSRDSYYAHTDGTTNPADWQPLREHLVNVAEIAKRFAEEARPGDKEFAAAAYAAGLWHDLGKYRREFQDMIRGRRPKGEATRHKQAGAAQAADNKQLDICFSILGHHGGIPDKSDMPDAVNSGRGVMEALLPVARADCPELADVAAGQPVNLSKFDMDLRIRLLFSCLVDADWLDTSDFHSRRQGWPVPQSTPGLDAPARLQNVCAYIKTRAAQCRSPEVAQLRAEVLAAAEAAGEQPRGIFSMTVPTGGGKTLSSLVFALKHAARHGLRRIIYVAPYLSIIEQNASVFRSALGDSADGLILEHHSLAEPAGQPAHDEDAAESDSARRLAENWEAPIVLTTSVQFYESLFSNAPGRCRKLHNIARSVVILDECQTLPAGLTAPTCGMLDQISSYLGCSIVLCTATQPAWKRDPVRLPEGFLNVHEIAPNPMELFRRLKRVEVNWPKVGETSLDWPDIAAEISRYPQVLCVVNTKHAALEIYSHLKILECRDAIHLSTNMCPAHRLRVIKEVADLLRQGKPCRLVSTQLVEAGVDLDFPMVMREMAPLESIVQAAGRCNREGLLDSRGGVAGGRVIVFRSRAGGMPRSGWYRNGAAIVEQDFLASGREPRIDHTDDLAEYYRRLYPTGDLDAADINGKRSGYCFREVSGSYRIIDEATTPLVITTWEPARQEVEKLLGKLRRQPSRQVYRQLQRFSVNVYEHELRQIAGACMMYDPPGVNVCCMPYDDALGLVIGKVGVVPIF